MKSFLLFALGVAVLFSFVPLSTWLATGRWQDALWAAKRYGWLLLLIVGVPMVFGTVIAFLSPYVG